jgi:hypothetical protein
MHGDAESVDPLSEHVAMALAKAGGNPQALLRYAATGKPSYVVDG